MVLKGNCAKEDALYIMRVRLGLILMLCLFLISRGRTVPDLQTLESEFQLSPSMLTMDQGEVQQFSATTGGVPLAVNWSIAEGYSGGTIDAQGKYTAPAAFGQYHVVATTIATPTRSAVATITVRDVAIILTPAKADIEPASFQQFSATVTGAVNKDVTWALEEEGSGGSITNTGLYAAPLVTGNYHVVATSLANPKRSASATVAVAVLAVMIDPPALALMCRQSRQFSATVAGSSNDEVSWSVLEWNGGSISSTGLYSAPTLLGEFHVVATSVAHPTISGLAKVLVTNSGFSDVADMMESRTSHTATLLQNGDVLFTGGYFINDRGYSDTSQTAEIFHPASNSFEGVSSKLITQRDGHIATLLADGKVLLAGGSLFEGAIAHNSAEIYDPATGLFTSTGAMKARRTNHTATLLKDGRVLIVGGTDGWLDESLNTGDIEIAEIYDEATGTFSTAGRMSSVRFKHTATLLPDGRVLVAGGSANYSDTGTNSAEIFDPATGIFTPSGQFVGNREGHTATLLNDGGVLLAGGGWFSDSWEIQNVYSDAYTFNVATGQFALSDFLITPRTGHTATLLNNGHVLLAGGNVARYQSTAAVELFDSANSRFLPSGSMHVARIGHAATLLNDGRVLVTGGNTKTAEVFTLEP